MVIGLSLHPPIFGSVGFEPSSPPSAQGLRALGPQAGVAVGPQGGLVQALGRGTMASLRTEGPEEPLTEPRRRWMLHV